VTPYNTSCTQLEDFNRGGGNSEYTKQYMARMNGEAPATNEEADATIQFLAAFAPRSKAEAQWEDTDLTSQVRVCERERKRERVCVSVRERVCVRK